MSVSRNQIRRRLLVAGVLVAFALRAYRLDGQALWSDEDITLDRSQKPVAEIVASLPVEQAPLYPILLRGWTLLAGTSDWSLRFPSLCFGVLAVPLAYAVARRLAGPPEGVALAWLLALHPYLVWYGQEARMYTLLLALGLATVAAVLVGEERVLRERRPGSRDAGSAPITRTVPLPWIAAGVLAALTVYTHYYGALVVFVLAVWALADVRRGRSLWPWLWAAASALAVYLPWMGRSLGVLGYSGWRAPTSRVAALSGDVVAWTAGRTLDGLQRDVAVTAMLVLAALGVWRWFADLARRKAGGDTPRPSLRSSHEGNAALAASGDPARAMLWLMVPAAIGLVLLVKSTDSDPRYFMGVLPAFYLAVAAGLVSLPRGLRVGAAAVLVVLAALGLTRMYTDPAVQKQAFGPFLSTVEAAAGHEDTVLFLDGPSLGLVRRYELPRSAVKVVNLKTSGNRARGGVATAARMAELAAEYPHLWLAEDGEADGLGAAWLDAHATAVSDQGFQSITLRRYEHAPSRP